MTTTSCYGYFNSPLGEILLLGDGEFVTGLFIGQHKGQPEIEPAWKLSDEGFATIRQQLAEYFAGRHREFDVPLKLAGTRFQQRVWQELVRIPFGATISYGELARRIGQPTASRGGRRQWPQSGFNPHPLPPRYRLGRRSHRLWRGHGQERMAPQLRTRRRLLQALPCRASRSRLGNAATRRASSSMNRARKFASHQAPLTAIRRGAASADRCNRIVNTPLA